MNPIDKLKYIAENQKTIRTTRLAPLLKEIETMYNNQGKKIKRQNIRLSELERQRDSKQKRLEKQMRS